MAMQAKSHMKFTLNWRIVNFQSCFDTKELVAKWPEFWATGCFYVSFLILHFS